MKRVFEVVPGSELWWWYERFPLQMGVVFGSVSLHRETPSLVFCDEKLQMKSWDSLREMALEAFVAAGVMEKAEGHYLAKFDCVVVVGNREGMR